MEPRKYRVTAVITKSLNFSAQNNPKKYDARCCHTNFRSIILYSLFYHIHTEFPTRSLHSWHVLNGILFWSIFMEFQIGSSRHICQKVKTFTRCQNKTFEI